MALIRASNLGGMNSGSILAFLGAAACLPWHSEDRSRVVIAWSAVIQTFGFSRAIHFDGASPEWNEVGQAVKERRHA